jgi:hypothetical protein
MRTLGMQQASELKPRYWEEIPTRKSAAEFRELMLALTMDQQREKPTW